MPCIFLKKITHAHAYILIFVKQPKNVVKALQWITNTDTPDKDFSLPLYANDPPREKSTKNTKKNLLKEKQTMILNRKFTVREGFWVSTDGQN